MRRGLRLSWLLPVVLRWVEVVEETHLCIDVQEHIVLIDMDQGGDDSAVSYHY